MLVACKLGVGVIYFPEQINFILEQKATEIHVHTFMFIIKQVKFTKKKTLM